MKKPVIIGVSALALLTLSATLFAQTTTGSSLIDQMKAAVHDFTLATTLNPGVTDLKSGPVSGKKTGDMLTAEEYNRILELVGQGGGGGKFEINDSTTKTVYQITYNPTDGWSKSSPTPTTTICPAYWTECKIIDTAAHDFCNITSVAGTAPHASLTYLGAKKYRLTNSYTNTPSLAPYSSGITVTCYDNIGTGGGGSTGGGGWTDIDIMGTSLFNKSCEYRFTRSIDGANGAYHGANPYYYANAVSDTQISWWFATGTNQIHHISASNKAVYKIDGAPYNPAGSVTKIQENCGGGGPGGLKNCAPVQGTSATAVACGYTVNAVCPTGKVAISGGTYQAGNISLQNTSPILTGGKMTGWYVTYVASPFCPDFNANNPSGKVVNGERPCFPLTGASVCGGATVVCCEE